VEVFTNLFSNAVRFSRENGRVRVEVGTREENGETVFTVRDDGIGIDPSHGETVFGLFEKLDPNSEGTGLGLALVRRIIEAHGGWIRVESEGVGQGSTFCFTLPLAGRPCGANSV
jgi:signal transduction histidine kinase